MMRQRVTWPVAGLNVRPDHDTDVRAGVRVDVCSNVQTTMFSKEPCSCCASLKQSFKSLDVVVLSLLEPSNSNSAFNWKIIIHSRRRRATSHSTRLTENRGHPALSGRDNRRLAVVAEALHPQTQACQVASMYYTHNAAVALRR